MPWYLAYVAGSYSCTLKTVAKHVTSKSAADTRYAQITELGTTPFLAVLDIPNIVKMNGNSVAKIPPAFENTCCHDHAKFFCLLLTMSPTIIRNGCMQTFENKSIKQIANVA